MRRTVLLALILVAGCHGHIFGGRTTDEDNDLNNFAEARQRAATYYDGRDYERAALQYEQALSFRPKHTATRLGYAYSLRATGTHSNLVKAMDEFEDLGKQRDLNVEVKRVYGLGLTCRNLATQYQRRSRAFRRRQRDSDARNDLASSHDYAKEGIQHFQSVMDIDAELARKQRVGPFRQSASLVPDAHAGIASCEVLLFDDTRGLDKGKPRDEIEERLSRARHHLEEYASMAKKARKFWQQRRERLLATDPWQEDRIPGAKVLDAEARARYEKRIESTVEEEVAIRELMMHTLLYLNRYPGAIQEATTILELNPELDDIFYWRGNAYAWLGQPDYKAALKDLKEYRRRQDLTVMTDDLVKLNRRIRDWEEKARQQERERDLAAIGSTFKTKP